MADTLNDRIERRDDDTRSVENSIMLCNGWMNAVREAFSPTPVCAYCGCEKQPHGRSLPEPRGYAGDCGCPGYGEAPLPHNLFPGEKAEIRAHIAANDPATIKALCAVAKAAHRRWAEEQRDIPYNEPIPSAEWDEADTELDAALAALYDTLGGE